MAIKSNSFFFHLQIPEYLSSEAKDLISNLLQKNPKDRLTLPDILKHPFMLKRRHERLLVGMNESIDSGRFTMSTVTNSHRSISTRNLSTNESLSKLKDSCCVSRCEPEMRRSQEIIIKPALVDLRQKSTCQDNENYCKNFSVRTCMSDNLSLRKSNNVHKNDSIFSNFKHYSTCDETPNCMCRCAERNRMYNNNDGQELRHSRCDNFSLRNDGGIFSQNSCYESKTEDCCSRSLRSNAKNSTDTSTVKKFSKLEINDGYRIVVDGMPVSKEI